MKNTKIFLSVASLAMLSGMLVGCGGGSKKLVVWVGEESATFYQQKCNEFLAANPDFGYSINVQGVDVGNIAGTITSDADAAADIYTVAHDNIGKFAAGKYAKPIMDADLTAQILADNPESFKKVIYSNLDGVDYLYAAPYISQALFLYYDQSKVNEGEEESFEGLFAAAQRNNSKAFTITGDDGYNFSFTLLASKLSDHSTSLKLYEGATTTSKGTCNAQGDDTIATLRWLQDAYDNANGFKFASSDGWEADLRNGGALAVIGGAWHYDAAASAIGSSKLGIALIPTFTISESQAEGLTTVHAGDQYRGGTFADCKVFMINGHSAASKYQAEQQLIKFLSSKEVQDESFKTCSNVPAYKGASANFKTMLDDGLISQSQYDLASKQVEMAEWGIPQPFITGSLNTYYYSKSAPAVYRALTEGKNYPESGTSLVKNTKTLAGIRQGLYLMEYIWMHGKNPDAIPDTLPVKA